MEQEFTGTYWLCNNCQHFWAYNDDRCPMCGKDDMEDINEEEYKSLKEDSQSEFNV